MRLRWTLILVVFHAVIRIDGASLDIAPPPIGGAVTQCAELTLVWDQKPPIHLHLQPERLINVTNLRDLGIQNDTFMRWVIDLPVDGQKFSFAYNTLAEPTVVYQSDGELQVAAGNTSTCLGSKTSNPSGSPSSTAPARRGSTGLGTILGAIIGGVLGLVALVALVFFILRRQRRRRGVLVIDDEVVIYHPVSPFLDSDAPNSISAFPISEPQTSLPPSSIQLNQMQSSSATSNPKTSSLMSSNPGSSTSLPLSGAGVAASSLPESKRRRQELSSQQSLIHDPPPIVHVDGGVRIPDELPPVYNQYSSS